MSDQNEGDGNPSTDIANEGDGNPSTDIANEAAEETAAEKERRERRAALMAHPHTQLRGILTVLRSPAAQSSDINTKYATLHAAVTRLVQQVLQHTPVPGDSEENINEDFERQQQSA